MDEVARHRRREVYGTRTVMNSGTLGGGKTNEGEHVGPRWREDKKDNP